VCVCVCVCVCGVMTANPQCDSHTHTIKTFLRPLCSWIGRDEEMKGGGWGSSQDQVLAKLPETHSKIWQSPQAWAEHRRSAERKEVLDVPCVMEGSQRYTLVIIIYSSISMLPKSPCNYESMQVWWPRCGLLEKPE